MGFRDYLSTFGSGRNQELPTEYLDNTIDRERRPVKKAHGWEKNSFTQIFNFYPSHYSPAERKLIMKFDISVLLFMCFSTYVKNLDNINIQTAYVSGMKEAIHAGGNDLNIYNTMYTVSYAVFQIPLTLLVTKPHIARYLLLGCETVWGILTLACAFVTNSQQVFAIRFLIGVAEACSFPATYVVFSSYLTDLELFQRAGIYGAFGTAGSASSGALQSRLLKTFDGKNGMEGWQWAFIFEAIITFGVTLYGFFLFPGVPTSCKKFGLFTQDDMTWLRKRMEGMVAAPKKFTKATFTDLFSTWQLPVLTLFFVFQHSLFYSSGDKLFMKSRKDLWTTPELNLWDTYTYCTGIPLAIFTCPLANWLGKMFVFNFMMVGVYYASIVLLIFTSWKPLMAGYFLQHTGRDGLSQLVYAWAAQLCKDSVEKKAIVLSFIQACAYATNAWLIPIQYNVKYAPKFHMGYAVNLGLVIAMHIMFFITWILAKYDLKICPKWAGNRHNFIDEQHQLDKEYNGDDESTVSEQNVDTLSLSAEPDSKDTGASTDKLV